MTRRGLFKRLGLLAVASTVAAKAETTEESLDIPTETLAKGLPVNRYTVNHYGDHIEYSERMGKALGEKVNAEIIKEMMKWKTL